MYYNHTLYRSIVYKYMFLLTFGHFHKLSPIYCRPLSPVVFLKMCLISPQTFAATLAPKVGLQENVPNKIHKMYQIKIQKLPFVKFFNNMNYECTKMYENFSHNRFSVVRYERRTIISVQNIISDPLQYVNKKFLQSQTMKLLIHHIKGRNLRLMEGRRILTNCEPANLLLQG